MYRNAAIAAVAPSPAADTNCDDECCRMSPTAYTPGTEVSIETLTGICPPPSVSRTPSATSALAVRPTYTNTPESSRAPCSPVARFLVLTPDTVPSPKTSSTTVSQMTSIFGSASTRLTSSCCARSSLRLWNSRTRSAYCARTRASSAAESPPPTTPTTSPLYSGPSQVAHWDTPLPMNSSSPGIPSIRRVEPAAIMTALAWSSPESELTTR